MEIKLQTHTLSELHHRDKLLNMIVIRNFKKDDIVTDSISIYTYMDDYTPYGSNL